MSDTSSYKLSISNNDTVLESSDSNKIALIDSNEVKGGRWIVSTAAERNKIPYKKRKIGMVVYVSSDSKEYTLINNPNADNTKDSDWNAFFDNFKEETTEKINSMFKHGMIMMFYGTTAPDGWAICDGTNGTPDLRNKFILGVGEYSLGATGGEKTHTLNQQESAAYQIESDAKIPQVGKHYHAFGYHNNNNTGNFYSTGGNLRNYETAPGTQIAKWNGSHGGGNSGYSMPGANLITSTNQAVSGDQTVHVSMSSKGGGKPHNNMPPYLCLNYIMKL